MSSWKVSEPWRMRDVHFNHFKTLQARGGDLLAFGLSSEKLVLENHQVGILS